MAEESPLVSAGERVLIAGCGRIGQALGERLAAGGARVLGLRRRPQGLPEAIEPLAVDLQDPDGLAARVPSGLDCVYYIVTPGSYDDAGYRQAFGDGLTHLAEVLRHQPAPPQRLVFVSSTAVYGQSQDEWLDETSPTEPERFSGRRLLEAEAIALAGPWAGVIARYGGIYGPGRDFLIRKVREGEPCQATQYTNRIHADDVVASLAHLGQASVAPGIYLGVDDDPSTQCEVLDFIAGELDLPLPPRAAPEGGGMRGVGSKRCSNRKLKASGYRFRYPTFREGYSALIRS